MLSMDRIYLIKTLHRQGLTTREIAAQLKINRESVLKYIKQTVLIPSPIKRERKTPIDPYLPYIHDLLRSDQAIASPKHRVTAQRIHALIVSGELTKKLPALAVSIRTVERAVKGLRSHIKSTVQNRLSSAMRSFQKNAMKTFHLFYRISSDSGRRGYKVNCV